MTGAYDSGIGLITCGLLTNRFFFFFFFFFFFHTGGSRVQSKSIGTKAGGEDLFSTASLAHTSATHSNDSGQGDVGETGLGHEAGGITESRTVSQVKSAVGESGTTA